MTTHRPPDGFIGRPLYPMRILGTTMMSVIGAIYVFRFETFHLWYLFILVLGLVYPHVARYIAAQLERRRMLELRTSLVDAFFIGSITYVVGFSHIPALAFLTIALANGMALGGVRFMALSAVSTGAGVMLPIVFYGHNYQPSGMLAIDLLSAAMLMVYFIMFALVAYKRSVLLQQSRQELRQQKNVVEIEKKKSENLLWALLPSAIASELEKGNIVEPRRHANATLLLADVQGFSAIAAGTNPQRLLAEVNHVFKGFDQIAERHRLEPMRTMVDGYFAVAGVPSESASHADDAVRAALEMQRFAAQYNESRTAAGEPIFDFRFLLHSGALASGLIETRRISFNVFGDTVDVLVAMRRAGASGVTMSAATHALLGEGLETHPADALRLEDGREIALHAAASGESP